MKTPVEMVIWAFEHPWHCLGALFIYGAIGVAYVALVLEKGTKTKSKMFTTLVPKFFVSLLAAPGVIFALALIDLLAAEHKGQLLFFVFLLLISSFGFYFGFESARFSLSKSKGDPFNPTDFIKVTLSANKSPLLKTNWIFEGFFACFIFLFTSVVYGALLLICWSIVQGLVPNLFLASETQLEFFFNEQSYTLAFFFGSLGTSCFYFGRATVFSFASKMAIAHMNKIHISENWEQTYANRRSLPVHPKNDWTYKTIFQEIAEEEDSRNSKQE